MTFKKKFNINIPFVAGAYPNKIAFSKSSKSLGPFIFFIYKVCINKDKVGARCKIFLIFECVLQELSLILKRSSVAGWYSGTAKDSQDTMEFSALSDVHPMIEKYPLDRVSEAYEQMHSGRVRFRVVLSM